MADGAFGEDGDVGGAAADVHQADAQFLLVLGDHRVGRGQLREDDVIDLEAAAAHALLDVLSRVDRTGDHVDLGFQAHAGHAQRLAHAFLVVDHVVLGQRVQHALVGGDGDRLGRVEDAVDVRRAHLAVADRHDAVGVQAADVVAGDADECRVDTAAGHLLGLVDGALDRLHGGLDVHHHALLQAAGRMGPDADDLQLAVGRDLAHQRHHLGGADVQADDHFAALHACHVYRIPPQIHCTVPAAATVVSGIGSRHATARPLG
ncbi:hypothetical protein D9M71_313200 [compost metagenome]